MKIFKYVGASGIKVIESGMLRFSPPSAFNDPFEMRPFIIGLAEEMEVEKEFRDGFDENFKSAYDSLPEGIRSAVSLSMARQLVEAQRPQALECMKSVVKEIAPVIRARTYSELDARLGVLCLSEKADNLLMWAHYADNHRGFVIEFDSSHVFFNRKRGSTDELYHLRKVQYSADRPRRYFNQFDGTTMWLTKSENWSYEDEWRMLVPLSDHTLSKDGMHLFAFPPECVNRIILGCRITENTENLEAKILNLLKNDLRYRHVQLDRAATDEQVFRLNISECNIR